MAFTDYYRVLGLPRFYVTGAEIQEAYHKRKDFFHPDNGNVTKDFSDIVTPQIEIAYSVLSDPTRKREYDKVLSLYVNEPVLKTFSVRKSKAKKEHKPKGKDSFRGRMTLCAIVAAIASLFVFGALGISWYAQQTTETPRPAAASSAPSKAEAPKPSLSPKVTVPANQPKIIVPPKETQPVALRPQNGHIFRNTGTYNSSEFSVITKGTQDYLVKLENAHDENSVVLFYVRAYSEMTVNVTPGTYILKYACGDGNSWYGVEQRFGKNTSYARADELFTFTETEGWTVELYFHENGNLSQTYIDEDEF